MFDLEIVKKHYQNYHESCKRIKKKLGKPLTLTEKILYAHLEKELEKDASRGEDYAYFNPDRVAMQDATAQMAVLQFISAGKEKVAVPSTIHCDHLIQANDGAEKDLIQSRQKNEEVYNFLQSAAQKYGIGFWKPGAGIIHQVILENYAFPGGMLIGTDSHTVNAGGLGMVAIGVGGADAVDVMMGMPWELKFPKIIGVKLTGKLSGWTSAKDIILHLAGILTVKGGTGSIVEYFGEGTQSLSCTGKGTICNMGAEIGATTSIFPYDESMSRFLKATERGQVAKWADEVKLDLQPDPEVEKSPEHHYDQVIHIDLDSLEPHINGPFSPDRAWPLSKFAKAVKEEDFPQTLSVGLIGSCTNSSYEDMDRAASVAKQAVTKKLKIKSELTITPGSEQIRYTISRDGQLEDFEKIGGVVLANACGPCIGQWKRFHSGEQPRNSIITSFNRNFAKRNDGNPNTHAFVASPEIVTALVLAGDLTFNPITDDLINQEGEKVKLDPPTGEELPPKGFAVKDLGFLPPEENQKNIDVVIDQESERLQILDPFSAWEGHDLEGLTVLLKAKGKCTTDHISMAGPWLKFRGHLENICQNLFLGAVNAFTDKPGQVKNKLTGTYQSTPDVAKAYRENNIDSIVIGDENYGEGSSREHAAMEPRFMRVRAVVTKSFARIHETNLKKQGVLAFTFKNKSDYDLIQEDDQISILGLETFSPTSQIALKLKHKEGTYDDIELKHNYNQKQIEWFQKGSALNAMET